MGRDAEVLGVTTHFYLAFPARHKLEDSMDIDRWPGGVGVTKQAIFSVKSMAAMFSTILVTCLLRKLSKEVFFLCLINLILFFIFSLLSMKWSFRVMSLLFNGSTDIRAFQHGFSKLSLFHAGFDE